MPEPEKPSLFPPPWWWETMKDPRKAIALVSESGDVLVATGDDEGSWAVVSEDHRRLLVAAPDLLEALTKLLVEAIHFRDTRFGGEFLTVAIDAANAAIAKVTNPETY